MEDLARQTAENARRFQHLDRKLIMHGRHPQAGGAPAQRAARHLAGRARACGRPRRGMRSGEWVHDTSHPAFYLPGQAFGTGNHRAFTALDPCKADGESCETGVDCCGGSCHREDNEPLGVCEVIACGNSDDRCEKDSDCCPGPNGEERFVCISNVCSVLLL
jgi:hypothetical protein